MPERHNTPRVGVHLPQLGAAATRDGLRDFAQAVEGIGFDSVWVSDHDVIPRRIGSRYPYGRNGQFTVPPDLPFLDPLSALTFVAGCTEHVALGTSVLVLPMRNPVLAAKSLASLDVLSGGRLIAGVGTGWLEEEYAALDAPFTNRGRRLDEYLQVLLALWTEREASFDGLYYHVHDLGFAPRPLQKPHPTLWIGGHSLPARRRAARFGDAWHAIASTPERVTADYAELRDLAADAGRPDDVGVTLRLGVHLDERRFAHTRDELCAYARAGVSHFVLEPPGMEDVLTVLEQLERFYENVWREVESDVADVEHHADDPAQNEAR